MSDAKIQSARWMQTFSLPGPGYSYDWHMPLSGLTENESSSTVRGAGPAGCGVMPAHASR